MRLRLDVLSAKSDVAAPAACCAQVDRQPPSSEAPIRCVRNPLARGREVRVFLSDLPTEDSPHIQPQLRSHCANRASTYIPTVAAIPQRAILSPESRFESRTTSDPASKPSMSSAASS